MIDGLRRKISKSIDGDPWDADQELEETSELPTDKAVLLAATSAPADMPYSDISMREHYMSLIRSAIQQGGTFHGQQIAIQWLRMTLAGLELRWVEPEAMWEGESLDAEPVHFSEARSYQRLFPSRRGQT